jgi:hypothetical protein
MATYTTQYPGNTALQTEVWTLTPAEAKAAMHVLDCHMGSYWHTNLAKPYRRACRAHAKTVRIYTAHFSTGELSTALYNADVTIERTYA